MNKEIIIKSVITALLFLCVAFFFKIVGVLCLLLLAISLIPSFKFHYFLYVAIFFIPFEFLLKSLGGMIDTSNQLFVALTAILFVLFIFIRKEYDFFKKVAQDKFYINVGAFFLVILITTLFFIQHEKQYSF